MAKVRKLFLWVAWAAIFLTWVATLSDLAREGLHGRVLLSVITTPPMALLLFYAEGLELAVAALGRHGTVLDPHRFFTRRQVVVGATISCMTLTSTYPWIYVPGLGRLHGAPAEAFSFAFVTTFCLWACQILPKRLAIIDPRRFMASPVVRPLLRGIDVFGALFDGPADDLITLCNKLLKPHAQRHVKLVQSCSCPLCSPMRRLFYGPSLLGGCECAVCSPDPDHAS